MPAAATNLRVLRISRKKPQPGDIFALRPPGVFYLFGRVIGVELEFPRQAPMPGANLIYVYRERATDLRPDVGLLRPDRLLLPPIFINRMPWTKGYFQTVAYHLLRPADVLERHCFRRSNGTYLDGAGNTLPGPVEPCGDWGLASYRTLDDEVSDALGIPRIPED